jgi:hypothetical protein
VGIRWSAAPLRPALASLLEQNGLALLIDRRVDPGLLLNAALVNVPLETALRKTLEEQQLAVCFPGPLIYVGPPGVVSRLRTLMEVHRDLARGLPADAVRKFFLVKRMQWPDLATPRDLLAELSREGGFRLVGLETVPHDLWAGAELPPLALVDRLTLIVAQFDLTLRIGAEGKEVTLARLPERVAIVRRYPGRGKADDLIKQWSALAPDARFKIVAGDVYVQGLVEEHERIARPDLSPPAGSNRTVPSGEEKRYTLRVSQKPLGPVLEQLASGLGIRFRIDRDALAKAGISLDQLIAFNLEDATLDELLEAVLQPAGCSYRRTGDVVDVLPAK